MPKSSPAMPDHCLQSGTHTLSVPFTQARDLFDGRLIGLLVTAVDRVFGQLDVVLDLAIAFLSRLKYLLLQQVELSLKVQVFRSTLS